MHNSCMPALTVMIHVTQYRGHQQSVKPDEACPVQHCHQLLNYIPSVTEEWMCGELQLNGLSWCLSH